MLHLVSPTFLKCLVGWQGFLCRFTCKSHMMLVFREVKWGETKEMQQKLLWFAIILLLMLTFSSPS